MDDAELAGMLRALASNDAGLIKVVRELGRCVGLLAVTADGLDEESRAEITESVEEIETLLARIAEFLPPVDD